jgi:imidazolonepropionase-like amidohydrolase
MMKRLCVLAVLAFLLVSPLAAQKANAPKHVAIRAGRVIDGLGGAPLVNAIILVEDERITAVGQGLAIPKDAEIIDLSKSTVLPGLIDCHTHITMQPSDYYEDLFRRSPIDAAVMAHLYAKRTLEAGFTQGKGKVAPRWW